MNSTDSHSESSEPVVLRCIVVDDDPSAREILSRSIEITDFLSLSGSFDNALQARANLKQTKADLIFLDVEMPEMSGIEFIRTFKDIPQVIMVTSKKEYAFDAFEHDVTDFLAKPFQYARFLKATEKALDIHKNLFGKNDSENQDEFMFVKSGQDMEKVRLAGITHLEALGDYVRIYVDGKKIMVLSTLKAFEARLPEKQFARIHRSFIANLEGISKIERGNTVFIGDITLPVSRTYIADLKERVKLFQAR